MPRNITVTFDDGSNHVYNNAPDDVTPEQIEARASRDFAGKRVTALDGGRAAPRVSAPARVPTPDIPGTPAGYADRVSLIPTDQYPAAPQAQRPAPVPQEERGLFSRIRAGVEAARNTIASIVPGGVGFGLGAAEGMLRNIASGKFGTQEGANLVEQTAAKRAQQFTEATVAKPPSALGQEYARDVGEFAQRHGASVLAGPLGMTGTGRHTENLRNARQGLSASIATAEVPPGLPPVAGEAPGVVKPAGGLVKRAVQPNPALLETVGSAEKAGLTVLPHHVAEGEAVRALGTAAGGGVYKQNTKAFTKALIKELDPDETASRLDTKTFHRVLDKQGKTIGENMAKYDMPVDDTLRARLESISKDAADNADADTGRMTMNRVREILGKAEAGEGSITGQAVRELDTAIGRQIRSNTKNQDLVARLRAVQDVLRDTAEGQMKPDEAKAVQQARRRYAYAMEILPDIDDFGRTGYYEPGQLWKRLTSSEAGRQRVANERGGLTDLAKAGALVADRSGTGHGYVSVGSNSVGVGASGMRAYASPSRIAEVAIGAIGGKKAYNRFGPNLVKRLAAEHDAELARAAQKPEPPPLELAAPDAPTPQGPRPDVRGEVPAEVPEWSTAAGAGVDRPGSQIPAIEPEGLFPAAGDDMPPARINPEPRGRVPDIPAVPGRPDMPDVMVAGGPSEVAGNLASGTTGAGWKGPVRETTGTNEAMQAPDAALAREQQGFAPKKPEPPTGGGVPPTDPRLAKIAELRQQAPSAAVKKVLDAREAEIKKVIKREKDVADLEAAAQATDDVDLRQSLLAEANKLRGGKLPVGEATEGQPALPKDKAEKIPAGQVIEGQPELPAAKAERIPVGEATEITPEVVEAAPERLPVGEATEMPERLPVGEVTENPIPVGEAMEFEHLPVGEATEITPEAVEPARGPVVPKATNVDNAPAAPAGGGRSEGVEQTKGEFTQSLAREPASWVIREKTTGKVVMETFDRKKVDALNTEKYEAVPVLQYLQELNRTIKENTRPEPQPTPTAPAGGGRSEGMEQAKGTAEQAIRSAVNAVPNRIIGSWTPVTVTHSGRVQQFLSNIKQVASDGKHLPAVSLMQIRPGRLLADRPTEPLVYSYRLTRNNELVEEGIPRAPTEAEAKRWSEAFGNKETPRAPQEVTQQAGVPAEPQGRTGGREAAEAGAGDRAQRAAESGGQSEGAKKEGVKSARPAGKALTPTEVKAEFQRQIDAVPRFDDGGPETITLKAGGSTARIQNTARRVAEYMKALGTVKGGKTPKPKPSRSAGPITLVKGFYGRKPTKSWGEAANNREPLNAIKDMIDDFDSQAAVDFAAAQGINLEEALKGDRKRLDRVRNLKPTPETP